MSEFLCERGMDGAHEALKTGELDGVKMTTEQRLEAKEHVFFCIYGRQPCGWLEHHFPGQHAPRGVETDFSGIEKTLTSWMEAYERHPGNQFSDRYRCPEERKGFWTEERRRCRRKTGHLGEHQTYWMDDERETVVLQWETNGAMSQGRDTLTDTKCEVCNIRLVEWHWGTPQLGQFCFKCNFWEMIIEQKDQHVIAGGLSYQLADFPNGFGGRVITFADIETGDLITNIKGKQSWFTQGEVPEYFRDRLPNTHTQMGVI